MTVVHLIHGYLGVGKTTFAKQLEADTGAVRLSADEWYLRLYTDGGPAEALDDALAARLNGQLEELWTTLVRRGVEVILDFGLWRRADRDRARDLAAAVGAAVRLYRLHCTEAVARERVRRRNADPGESWYLSDAAFDHLKAKYEPLGADETATDIDTTDTAPTPPPAAAPPARYPKGRRRPLTTLDISDPELDARFAAGYDGQNQWRVDDEFFLALAKLEAGRVVDVGCGTGRLTIMLANAGLDVTGVDPNPAFINIAYAKPGTDRVAWIRGTAADLPDQAFDTALMTSHVAQVFLTNADWADVLSDLKRCLRPGGLLAFDTRDPADKAWVRWASDHGYVGEERVVLPDGLVRDTTTTFVSYTDGVAMFETSAVLSDGTAHHRPEDQDLSPGTLWSRARWAYRFRRPELVKRSLEHAGFQVENMFGGWQQEPLGHGVGEIVVLARA